MQYLLSRLGATQLLLVHVLRTSAWVAAEAALPAVQHKAVPARLASGAGQSALLTHPTVTGSQTTAEAAKVYALHVSRASPFPTATATACC